MRKREIILLVMACFVMVGCSDDGNEGQPEENNTVEARESQRETEPDVLSSLVVNNAGYAPVFFSYCWENEGEPCEEPEDPQQIMLEEDTPPIRVDQGESISVLINQIPELDITSAEDIIVEKFDSEETYTLSESGDVFNAPEEEGRFFYTLRIQWETGNPGEAIYVFGLSVRP